MYERGSIMMKKTVLMVLGILLVTSVPGIVSLDSVRATGTTLYVGGDGPGNYSTIQAAVSASQDS